MLCRAELLRDKFLLYNLVDERCYLLPLLIFARTSPQQGSVLCTPKLQQSLSFSRLGLGPSSLWRARGRPSGTEPATVQDCTWFSATTDFPTSLHCNKSTSLMLTLATQFAQLDRTSNSRLSTHWSHIATTVTNSLFNDCSLRAADGAAWAASTPAHGLPERQR